MDCFIATTCNSHYEERGRGRLIRRCVPEFLPHFNVTVFDFGSHPEQQAFLDSLGVLLYRTSPFPDLSWELEGSERRRFLLADRLVKSDIYIVADDDCLPLTPDWVTEGERILRRHPDFGMLCVNLEGSEIFSPPGLYEDENVMQTRSGGGVRFIRKGAVKHFRGYEGERGFDGPHGRSFADADWRVGFFRSLWFRHLGGGYSVVWSRARPPRE